MLCLQRSKIKESALRLLLKYAYPCIEYWKDKRKIPDKILKKVYSVAIGKGDSREIIDILENLIPVAIREIEKLSRGEITEDIIREYFWKRHKEVIGNDKPEYLKLLCLVRDAIVEDVKGEYVKVRFLDRDEIRIVRKDFVKDVKKGDLVKVHYYYICEKV